jgi:hypothetical protein
VILKKEEPRVAHLAIYTRLVLSYSLCDSSPSLCDSPGSFAFCVINFLRLLRHSFTSYNYNHCSVYNAAALEKEDTKVIESIKVIKEEKRECQKERSKA